MRTENRLFGKNMQVFMYEDNLSNQYVAKQLHYSDYELCKILSARAYVSIQEEEDIADFLKRPLDDFFQELESSRYEAAGCYECRGTFESPENRELIFDIFDMYCDVQEALLENH